MFNELNLFSSPLFHSAWQFWELLFLLIFGHCLADFVLQSPTLSKAKNSTTNPKEIWIPAMLAHCIIHAGVVLIITGKLWLALYQLLVHFIIDDLKCRGKLANGKIAFAKDQVLHISDMVVIAILFFFI
jgi:hypothetical protein